MRRLSNLASSFLATLLLISVSTASAATPAPASSSDHAVNLSLAPIAFILGSFNLAVGFKVSDRVVLAPKLGVSSYSSGNDSASGFSFGVELPISLSAAAFQSSWVLVPSVEYATAKNGGATTSGIAAGVDIGYWWFFDGGFNLSTGLGIQYFGFDFSDIGLSDVSAVVPSVMFKLGYAF